MRRMKSTKENIIIIHEIGHLIMYMLYLLTSRKFDRDYFINNIFEISIVSDEISLGRVEISNSIKNSGFCFRAVYLSGVLFSLEYIESYRYNFESKEKLMNHLFEVYEKTGGSDDLTQIIKKFKRSSIKLPVYAYEFRKMIKVLKENESIQKIIHKLYRGLQKNKSLSGDACYNIIKMYIPELKKLGKEIYNPFNRFRINAKAVLF